MLNFCSDPKLLLFKTGTIHRTIAPVQTYTRALGLAAGDEPLRAGGAPGTTEAAQRERGKGGPPWRRVWSGSEGHNSSEG